MLMVFLLFVMALFICHFFAGYDGRFQNGKYITIKNPKLRALLIDKSSYATRGNRPQKDINKISLEGLVLYVFGFLTLVLSVLFYFIIPKTPIEPWQLETDKFFMYVDTLNEKWTAISLWLFFLLVMFYMAIRIFGCAKKAEKKWEKTFSYIAFAVLLAAVIFVALEIFLSI